jgi:hypothetical protein
MQNVTVPFPRIGLQNLIYNQSFGDWNAGVALAPNYWVLTGAGATIARSATVREGVYSAAVTRVGNDCTLGQITLHANKGIAYWQGRRVTLSMWVNASVAARGYIYIDDGVAVTRSPAHTGVAGWELLTVSAVIAPAATRVEVGGEVRTGNTTVYFDGAMAVEGGKLLTSTEKPADYSDVRHFAAAWFNHDISTVGNQVVTGLGFSPRFIEFHSVINTATVTGAHAHGSMDAAGNQGTIFAAIGVACTVAAEAIHITDVGATWGQAVFVSMDNDGFTILWSKGGLPVGTVLTHFRAFR